MYFKSGWNKELWLWCLTPLDVNNISVILRVIWNGNTRKISPLQVDRTMRLSRWEYNYMIDTLNYFIKYSKIKHCISYKEINDFQFKHIFYLLNITSVDTEMCCPKDKCGCQYFILLTLKKTKSWTQRSWIFFNKN